MSEIRINDFEDLYNNAIRSMDELVSENQKLEAERDTLKAENERLASDTSEIRKAGYFWLRSRNEMASQRDRLAEALREIDTFMDNAPTVRWIIRAALSAVPNGAPAQEDRK